MTTQKLIEAHAKENCVKDAERIFKQMNGTGFLLDILTAIFLVHMYRLAILTMRRKHLKTRGAVASNQMLRSTGHCSWHT